MLPEVLDTLSPRAGEIYVDGTFGNGGYTQAFLEATECSVVALDRDPTVRTQAAVLSEKYGERFRLIQTSFSKMDELGIGQVDAVALDIGVSSTQIDQGERGFSFQKSGPLDMRMSQSGATAAEAVAELPQAELEHVFRVYGEEKHARRAARLVVRAREENAIATTDGLADLLERGLGRKGRIHPATRVFQALRIFINDELGELYEGLCAAERILKPGGRLIAVTFHSLEDRIVKTFMRQRCGGGQSGSRYTPVAKKPPVQPSFEVTRRSVLKPSEKEVTKNARSRSARLRWALRTNAEPIADEYSPLRKFPRLQNYGWAA
ncbi:MAG: 16S rRNA (cytosine(1402)-N(4))-methyltransferase RsmH [Hyphomonadaceae bacterium]|nr:16S rRNA (cytosine(1402)-N(4))-methyltransferase RsmH [Hyphomonadaceae bacterium]